MNQDYLKSIISYDPETGMFTALVKRGKNVPGKVLGTKHSDGSMMIYINYKRYRAARLAWFYMTGTWPEHEIDHINRINSDNRWSNLREATRSENAMNHTVQPNNKTGHKNIGYHNIRGYRYYVVRIRKDGKIVYHEYFKSLEEAIKNRDEQLPIHHGVFKCV